MFQIDKFILDWVLHKCTVTGVLLGMNTFAGAFFWVLIFLYAYFSVKGAKKGTKR